jgi:hypothetical protein
MKFCVQLLQIYFKTTSFLNIQLKADGAKSNGYALIGRLVKRRNDVV